MRTFATFGLLIASVLALAGAAAASSNRTLPNAPPLNPPAAAAVDTRPAASSASPESTSTLVGPTLSVDPQPAPAPSTIPPTIERDDLKEMLNAVLERSQLHNAHVSMIVKSLDTGEVLFAHNPDDLMNPASNVKLVTAAAALARLGSDFRFATDFACDAPLRHGYCHRLYIRGRGDPTLYTERIFGIAGELLHRGLRRVGDIVVDDTYFDAERQGPGWDQDHADKPYMAPIGALSVNHNTVAVYVSPGDSIHSSARIALEPMSDYFVIENRVKTASRHSRERLIPRSYADGDKQHIVVSGRLPVGRDTSVFYKKVDNPPLYAGATFKEILRTRGIMVRGRVRLGAVPDDAVRIYVDHSDELAEIVRQMDKVSSNFVAEQLLKTLGAELKGMPGTWPKGIAVAEEYLASIGVAPGTYVMKNGSGLNDTNRFSARQIATVLTAAAASDFYPELAASLGIAGRDGTVRNRMEGTPAEGRLRAKTGTLENVTALSGYVRLTTNERLVYSILTNDLPPRHHGPYVAAMDSLAEAIATGGMPERLEAPIESPEESEADMRAKIATFANLGRMADPSNLPFLLSALRGEQDPIMRAVIADAIYKSDNDNGVSVLLDAVPADPAIFHRLRSFAQALAVPTPTVSSLIDIAADGNADGLDKLIVVAREAKGDAAMESLLSDGFQEIGRTAPDELFAALNRAPGDLSAEAVTLLGEGIAASDERGSHPFLESLKEEVGQKDAPAALALATKLREALNPPKPVVIAPLAPAAAPGLDVHPAMAPAGATVRANPQPPVMTSAPGG